MVENIHVAANYQFTIARLIEHDRAIACPTVYRRGIEVEGCTVQRVPN